MVGNCKTVQYTMLFNTFVFMQVFNEINSRKLGEREFNVFAGFFNNWLFTAIIIFTAGVQVLLVEVGGFPVRCVPLSWQQHVACICIGAFSLILGIVVKFVPSRIFKFMAFKKEVNTEDVIRHGSVASLRKSRTMQMSLKAALLKKVEDERKKTAVSGIN
jgi:magnesium-transporting ATPase (P-type)